MLIPEMEQLLLEKFPILYRNRYGDKMSTCMCWGFEVGEGWSRLIYDLSEKLEFLSNQFNVEIVMDQVKEKFGGARFYLHVENPHNIDSEIFKVVSDIAFDLEDYYEHLSYSICEDCGDRFHVKLRTDGWHRTLCDDCEMKRKASAKI